MYGKKTEDDTIQDRIAIKEVKLCLLGSIIVLSFKTFLEFLVLKSESNAKIIQVSQTTSVDFQGALFCIASITIFAFIILAMLLHPFLIMLGYKIFSKQYPNDKIIFTYRPLAIIWFALYCVPGFFFGYYIIPLLIYPSITHIDMVTHENLILYALLSFILLYCVLILQTSTSILTNKRIMFFSPYFQPNTKSIVFDDLKHVIYDKNRGYSFVSKKGNLLPFHRLRKSTAAIFGRELRKLLGDRVKKKR